MDPKRPWYKSPVTYVAAAIIFLGWAGLNSTSSSTITPEVANTAAASAATQAIPAAQPQTQTATPAQIAPQVEQNPTLSSQNYYTNVSGNTVHSPAYTSDGSVPSGATAECRDGTYSFSEHRSGTCSHHGGVMRWL
jgi:hypothetical protein